MKPIRILMLASIALAAPAISHAQVAGTTLLGVSVEEMRNVALGWSVKRTILGQPVYNDNNERVGSIDDSITAPDKAISYGRLPWVGEAQLLPGATKEALKASPEFQYAQ